MERSHWQALWFVITQGQDTGPTSLFFFFFFLYSIVQQVGREDLNPPQLSLKHDQAIQLLQAFYLFYYTIYIYIKVLPCICSKIACQIFPNFKVKNRVDGGREGRRPTSMLVFPLLPSLNHKSLKFPLHLGYVWIPLILLKTEN